MRRARERESRGFDAYLMVGEDDDATNNCGERGNFNALQLPFSPPFYWRGRFKNRVPGVLPVVNSAPEGKLIGSTRPARASPPTPPLPRARVGCSATDNSPTPNAPRKLGQRQFGFFLVKERRWKQSITFSSRPFKGCVPRGDKVAAAAVAPTNVSIPSLPSENIALEMYLSG